MAVSYTHLRAHETVLDLVCRLLLEKKKKRKPCLLYTTDAGPERHSAFEEGIRSTRRQAEDRAATEADTQLCT